MNKSSLATAGFVVVVVVVSEATEGIPNLNDDNEAAAVATGLLPGFGVSQLKHFSLLKSFLHMQTSHSHWVLFCLAASCLKKSSATGTGSELLLAFDVSKNGSEEFFIN